MTDWVLIIILWVLLYSYLIIGSIDFGSGVFLGYFKVFRREKQLSAIIKSYLSPVWEMTNIIFLFFFIGILSFLPHILTIYEGGFIVPSLLILLVLLLRSGFYAYYYYTGKESRIFYIFYAVTGLCIPAALATGLTISEGGYINNNAGKWHLDAYALFTSFYFWAVLFLAVISVIYISLMFITYFASNLTSSKGIIDKLKVQVFLWSVPTILGSAIVFAGLQKHNPEHFNKILDLSWLFLLSLICLMIAITFIFQEKHYVLAFFFVIMQFFFAFFGYGISHLPYIIYPDIMIDIKLFNSAIYNDIISIIIVFIALLIPILLLYLRLFIVKNQRD